MCALRMRLRVQKFFLIYYHPHKCERQESFGQIHLSASDALGLPALRPLALSLEPDPVAAAAAAAAVLWRSRRALGEDGGGAGATTAAAFSKFVTN